MSERNNGFNFILAMRREEGPMDGQDRRIETF